MKKSKPFRFKKFYIHQDRCSMKVGTDGVLLGAWADVTGAQNILDIGTGTGVIAIMLAQRTDKARIDALEIDEPAFEQARENMAGSPWSDRLHAIHDSVQDFGKKADQTYDLIVSNPPFFTGGTFSNSQDKASVRHTIKLPHGDLLSAVRTLLSRNGKFCAILPYMEGLRFRELAASYGLYCTHMTSIKPLEHKQVERLLLQFERKEKTMTSDHLVIQNEGANNWTEEFISLTGEFYDPEKKAD